MTPNQTAILPTRPHRPYHDRVMSHLQTKWHIYIPTCGINLLAKCDHGRGDFCWKGPPFVSVETLVSTKTQKHAND